MRALVMELVEGQTLADRLAAGPLSVEDVIAIGRQIADAIEYAHEQGVIHRDLKPANIKLRPDGTVKVLDFGLAKASEQGSGIGSPGSAAYTSSPTLSLAATQGQGDERGQREAGARPPHEQTRCAARPMAFIITLSLMTAGVF